MRRVVWISLALIGILLLQFPLSPSNLAKTYLHETEATPLVPALPAVTLGSQVTYVLNNTNFNPLFNVPISNPGCYNFTMIFTVNYSDPFVDFYFDLYDSASEYAPQLDTYLTKNRRIDSFQFWSLSNGTTSQYFTEFMVVQPGSALVEFNLAYYTPWDQLIVNFTVSQAYSFADALSAPLGQNTTIQWTEDNSWNASKLTIPANDLYNVTLFISTPFNTTASWGGDPNFRSFETLALFDLNYGSYLGYSQWDPLSNIPFGAALGIATWNEIQTIPLQAGDYYLVGKSNPFVFLNGSHINLTIYVEQVPTQPIGADESIKLSFNATASVNDLYIAVTVPSPYMIDFYFSNPEGSNWSIATFDAWHAFPIPPTYDFYEDPTTNLTMETRFQYGISLKQPMMATNPVSGLTGQQYFEPFMLLGSEVFYIDGVPQFANFPPGGGPANFWNTFYLLVQGTPGFLGPPSPTFNLSLNLDTISIPQLTPTPGIPFPINQTIGPFYHGFLLTVESGMTYDLSVTPTNFTSSGVVMIQALSAYGQFYRDWGLGYMWPLSKIVGISGMWGPGLIMTYSLNATTTIRFMAVRNTTFLVVALGTYPVVGPSDTTEIEVSLSVTQPIDYNIGTNYTLTTPTTEYDFTSFNVPLIEGYRYQLSLSIDYGSVSATGIFFDDYGHTPFDIGLLDLWAPVDHSSSMSFTGTYTATKTGTVTFALIHEGDARFSINLIDDTPPTVAILEPSSGAVFESGDVIINFTASDEIGLASLIFGYNGNDVSIPTDTTSHSFFGLPPGLYHIYLVATDTQGNTATDSIAILILPDPTSWTLGRDAAYAYLMTILIGAVAATGIICFLLGYFIKRRRKL